MIMTAAIVCMAGIQMMAQPKLPYRNASLPIEERVSDLLSRDARGKGGTAALHPGLELL